jgi:putative heme iron utilization protein
MNTDHGDNLRAYCRHVHGVETPQATLIGIDPDGFDIQTDDTSLRFEFSTRINNAQEARLALVAFAQAARS